MLNSYYNQKQITVHLIRSRDKNLLSVSDILVDVGEIYDPSNHRYDHHQEDCNEVFSDDYTIPLSSIGMVWKHFGAEILSMYISSHDDFNKVTNWEDHIDKLHSIVYKQSIQEIDGHDNGISPIDGGKRNYCTYMSFSAIISSINTSDTNNTDAQMRAFDKAVRLFGNIFEIKLEEIIRKYLDFIINYDIVKKYIDEVSDNREYLIITDNLPTIYKCLNILDPTSRFKFVIFKNTDEITIKTRKKKGDMFRSIIPLVSEEYAKKILSEPSDLIFIHKKLFIAKTKTIEAAIELIEYSIAYTKSKTKYPVPLSYFNIKNPIDPKWALGLVGGLGIVGVMGGLIFAQSLEE